MLSESIVTQTVLLAKCKKAAFSEFYLEELQAFIAIHIVMGLLKLPQIKDLLVLSQSIGFHSNAYTDFSKFLHVVDSTQQKKSNEPGYDPLFKVHPLIDHFLQCFRNTINPPVNFQ